MDSLKIRSFRYFLLGHFISFTGSWLFTASLQWLVYVLTYKSSSLGLVNFASSIPTVLFGFLAGTLIDKFDKKKLFMLVLFLSAIPSFLIGLLYQLHLINFYLLLFLVFVAGSISAFDIPLRNVIVSLIVPKNLITQAVSFQSLSFNLARALGPFIAGYFLAMKKYALCFYLNALSFLPFLFFVKFFIKIPPNQNLSSRGGFKASMKEVFKFIRERDEFLRLYLGVIFFTFFGLSLMVLLPVIIHKGLGGESKAFTRALSFIGLGAMSGALFLIIKKNIKNKFRHLFIFECLFSFSFFLISLCTNLIFLFFLCYLLGVSVSNFIPVANSFFQEKSPPEIRGRILSLYSMSFLGVYPFGTLFTGYLADLFSYKIVIWVYLSLVLVSGFFLILRKVQNVVE